MAEKSGVGRCSADVALPLSFCGDGGGSGPMAPLLLVDLHSRQAVSNHINKSYNISFVYPLQCVEHSLLP